MDMKIVKQLAIFLENQPGALLRMSEDFAKENINIKAMSVTDTVDHAVVRMIVDEPTKAIHLLGDAGVLVIENDLLEVPLDNTPGQITELCKKLMDLNLNMEYAYGSTNSMGEKGYLYIRVMDTQKVIEAFK